MSPFGQAVQENCLEEMRLPLDVVDAVKQAGGLVELSFC